MSKISKAIKASGSILRKPFLLNLINESEEEKRAYVAKKYNLPDGLKTVDITEFVTENIKINPYSYLDGSSLPTDFALLKAICIKNQVEDYLEIGTWRGESAANVAPHVKKCYSLNISDDEMRKQGASDEYINMHRFFSKNIKNITHLQENSQTFDFSALHKKFDLIFIDGDHHSESIATDTKNAFKLLKDNRSVIVWHDYGMGTETTRFNVLAGILDGCPAEKRNNLYHVSNTLCAIYSPVQLPSHMRFPNQKPDIFFSVELKIQKIR